MKFIHEIFQEKFATTVQGILPIGGGCINNASKVITDKGDFFIKYTSGNQTEMFQRESEGLKALHDANTIPVAQTLHLGQSQNYTYLIQPFIYSEPRTKTFWADFGKRLAKLHKKSHNSFGFHNDNYIGSLSQKNHFTSSWYDFFWEQRILPMLRLANDSGKMSWNRKWEKLRYNIESIVPSEKPALIHGDLWSGNFLCNEDGEAILIDPAVYFGHREMEISFTTLFGGFDEEFYEGYNEEFPLQPAFESRIDIHNLYPLLVHVNLFGGGYIHSARSILEKYS